MPPIRSFQLVEGNIGILERGEVAIKHCSRAHLAAYRVLAGDGAEYFGISGDGNMVDKVDRLGQVALNPGANPHAIALIQFHAQRNACRDKLRGCGADRP